MTFQPKVPLLVDSPTRRGETQFLVWDGRPGQFVRHGRRPGYWSATADGRVAESKLKRRLSDTSAPATLWHRLEFDCDREARDYAEARRREGYGTYLGDVDRYLTRIIIEDPAFFAGFPMTRPLRILSLDIEQRTDGTGFPPRDAPMVAIALGFDDAKPVVTVAARDEANEPDDEPIMAAWHEAITAYDPDIIVGFNVGYDIGVLAARGAILGYPLEDWGRTDENGERARSLVRQEFNNGFTDDVYYVGGRIVWDLRANANPITDYNLSGCKDFKLKTIAEFLGWPVIKEDTHNTLALWRDREADLVAYNRNDVDLVWRMVLRYLPDRIRMAEFFGAPLDNLIDVSSGWPGTIAAARSNFEEDIVSDGKNVERHRQWLRKSAAPTPEDEYDDGDSEAKGHYVKPQGAIVAMHKRGLFRPIFKVDFASLYPHVIIAVRCGPDNTRIVGTGPLREFTTTRVGEILTLSIPDANYGHNWLIEVRGRSKFAATVERRMKERLAAKYEGDDTRAAILKTLLNSLCFGVHGALGNRYGCLPLLIIATGVPRELIKAIGKAVETIAIETDTDGIFLTEKVPVSILNRVANNVARRLDIEPLFKLDFEEAEAGYFHEAKQYLLLKNGKMQRHGVAMKGRGHPAAFDHIIETVGGTLLRQGRDAALPLARKALDLATYEPKHFVQRCTLNKPIAAYEHESKEVKVARAHEALTGEAPRPGRSYEYVRTREGLVPPTAKAMRELDEWAYLSRVMLPALSRLGFGDLKELGVEEQTTLAKARSKRPVTESSLARFL